MFPAATAARLAMKILTTIKRTPERNTRMKIGSDGGLAVAGVKYEPNPFDELAVEEALRIREARGEVEVVAVTVGGDACREQLLSALAMGADRAIRVAASDDLDGLQVATVLAAVVRREAPDLVLMGKLAVDDENGQVCGMLAGLLDWPQANFASKIELSDDAKSATVTREVDGGLEQVRVELPAVITTDLRLNEPRYASLPGIMKAKKKPMEVVDAEDLTSLPPGRSRILAYRSLPTRQAGVKCESPEDLARRLIEAKLI